MSNVAGVQAEIEYRHQRLLQEAEEHRRVSRARAGRPARARMIRLPRLLARTTQSHRTA